MKAGVGCRMDEDSEPLEREAPPKMSMTPSWVMLGFVLGALFVLALPTSRKPAPPSLAPVVGETPAPKPKPAPPQLSTIEAVFSSWGDQAVWSNDTTEVALWNTDRNDFSEFYEVRRVGEATYFRSIPRLTRRVINHGKPPPVECPLQFTETEEQYREWVEHGRTERRPQSENR
jgi:hypothetical protein